jgi:hypothetical protein
MKPVYIRWEDHCGFGHSGWLEKQHLDNKPCVIDSIGYIVDEDDKYITLAACYDINSDGMKNVSTIVKSCIIKRKRITI